ncbi:hypothetical protein Gogos_002949, partial [Gossypium gossypioides]|nr:hypothetical protein [Gossypium gossypioides]
RRNCAVFVKATGDSSESSTSLSIVKSVRNVWDKSDEDRVGLIGLGFAAIVALWTSTNLISVIDKLPIIPNVLEIIGILFSLGRTVPNHRQVIITNIWIVNSNAEQIMEKQKKNANLPVLVTVEKSETPTSPAVNWVEKIRSVKCKTDVKL